MITKDKDDGKKVVLMHRRKMMPHEHGPFDSEREARKFAEDHRLLIVHEDTDEEGRQRLLYLND